MSLRESSFGSLASSCCGFDEQQHGLSPDSLCHASSRPSEDRPGWPSRLFRRLGSSNSSTPTTSPPTSLGGSLPSSAASTPPASRRASAKGDANMHHSRSVEASPTRVLAPAASNPATIPPAASATATATASATPASSCAPLPQPPCGRATRHPVRVESEVAHANTRAAPSRARCLAEARGFNEAATERERHEHNRRVADAVAMACAGYAW